MILPVPPAPRGDAEQQLRHLYGYLYRLQEQLNTLTQTLEDRLSRLESK